MVLLATLGQLIIWITLSCNYGSFVIVAMASFNFLCPFLTIFSILGNFQAWPILCTLTNCFNPVWLFFGGLLIFFSSPLVNIATLSLSNNKARGHPQHHLLIWFCTPQFQNSILSRTLSTLVHDVHSNAVSTQILHHSCDTLPTPALCPLQYCMHSNTASTPILHPLKYCIHANSASTPLQFGVYGVLSSTVSIPVWRIYDMSSTPILNPLR